MAQSVGSQQQAVNHFRVHLERLQLDARQEPGRVKIFQPDKAYKIPGCLAEALRTKLYNMP